MVSETLVETPPEIPTDPEPLEQETETPAPVEGEEGAAPAEEAAAVVPQVEVTPPEKPDYITREEWEKERDEVARQAAEKALEEDRRRRQTENARKAQQEERHKARIQSTVDTVRTAMVARGLDAEAVTDQTVITAIDRVAQERAEALAGEQASLLGEAWDFITAPVYEQKVDLDGSFEPAARLLAPRVQHLIDTIRPQFEEKAAKEAVAKYIAEEQPKAVEAEIARRAAVSRVGQEELKRVEVTPAATANMLEAWETRVAHQGEDGYPLLTDADWDQYKAVRREHGL